MNRKDKITIKSHIHKKSMTQKIHLIQLNQLNQFNQIKKLKDNKKPPSIKNSLRVTKSNKLLKKQIINQIVKCFSEHKTITVELLNEILNRVLIWYESSIEYIIICIIKKNNYKSYRIKCILFAINILIRIQKDKNKNKDLDKYKDKDKDKEINFVKIFDLILQKQKMEYIYLINWKDTGCTLSHILNSVIKMTEENRKKKEIFIVNMLHHMIQNGVLSDNSQTYNNTFSLAIRSNNLNIISQILESNCQPKNLNNDGYTFYGEDENFTLNRAINTKNLEIIKIAIQNNAMPNMNDVYDLDNNSLIIAIRTRNPDIVFQIVAHMKNANCHFHSNSYFHVTKILEGLLWESTEIFDFNKIINLVMCSGIQINRIDYSNLTKKNLLRGKFEMCKFFKISDLFSKFTNSINEIKEELTETMNELIERSTEKLEIINELKQRLGMIPWCLIYIIHEYNWIISSVNFIDWMNIDY